MTNILACMIQQITSSVEKEKKVEKRGQKASPSIAKLRNQIEENIDKMQNVTVSDIVSMFSADKEEAGRTLAYFGKIGVLVRVGFRENPPNVKKRREVVWSSKNLLTSKEKSV